MWYPLDKGEINMPHKILLDDLFEELFDDILYIKLNTYVFDEKKN